MRYGYRCPLGHENEQVHPMGKQPATVPCRTCGEVAKRYYTVPFIAVDNTDKVDYRLVCGQNFSNRQERDAWLSEHKADIMADSDFRTWEKERQDQQDLYRRVTERATDEGDKSRLWGEYLGEKAAEAQSAAKARMEAAGVDIKIEDPASIAESEGEWVETVEGDYLGERHERTNPDGSVDPYWDMNMPTERVEEPSFEEAVS